MGATDRSVTINMFELISAFSMIVSSYLYSLVVIEIWYLQVGMLMLLGGGIVGGYMCNRFVMESRREVERRELEGKGVIIRGLLEGRILDGD